MCETEDITRRHDYDLFDNFRERISWPREFYIEIKSILFEIPTCACDKVQACSPRGRPRCFKAMSSRKIFPS